jgi:succinate dehydrogenase flavin-adding protein (antitoxin of CptAB toxin-antitoxin module)
MDLEEMCMIYAEFLDTLYEKMSDEEKDKFESLFDDLEEKLDKLKEKQDAKVLSLLFNQMGNDYKN